MDKRPDWKTIHTDISQLIKAPGNDKPVSSVEATDQYNIEIYNPTYYN